MFVGGCRRLARLELNSVPYSPYSVRSVWSVSIAVALMPIRQRPVYTVPSAASYGSGSLIHELLTSSSGRFCSVRDPITNHASQIAMASFHGLSASTFALHWAQHFFEGR